MGYEHSGGRYYRDHQDHGDHRDRGDWRSRDDYRDRAWRSRDHERGYRRDYDDDRGFLDRAGDEVRSWFGDEEAERRRRRDERMSDRDEGRRYRSGGERDGGRFAKGPGGYESPGYGGMAYAQGGSASSDYGTDYGAGRGAGATMNYGLGAGRDHDGWGQDPNYSAWRRRQMEELDRDYAEYRRENEQRFHHEFGSWRTTRQNQRNALRQAQEHQEVVGSDGAHVGTVDHVRGDRIILTKTDKDAGGHHHSIPVSWIADVTDKVRINRTAAQAQAAWKDEEDSEGPHYLNRAFSGTY